MQCYTFFFALLINLTISHNFSQPLLIYQTREGIGSHLRQLRTTCAIVRSLNRKAILVPFGGGAHYRDLARVNLHDYFELPDCFIANDSVSNCFIEISNETDCVVLHRNEPHAKELYKGFLLPSNTTLELYASFNFSTAICVGAFFDIGESIYFEIKETYRLLANLIQKELFSHRYVDGAEFITVHWRRGDQLRSRCISNQDHSVNCNDPDTFLNVMHQMIKAYVPYHAKIHLHISTNEDDYSILEYFSRLGYSNIYQVTEHVASKHNRSLNSAEQFVIDLHFMCTSTYHFGWGYGSIQYLLKECRNDQVRNRLTVHDGQILPTRKNHPTTHLEVK